MQKTGVSWSKTLFKSLLETNRPTDRDGGMTSPHLFLFFSDHVYPWIGQRGEVFNKMLSPLAGIDMKWIIFGMNAVYLHTNLLPYLSVVDHSNWIDDQLEWLMAEAHT